MNCIEITQNIIQMRELLNRLNKEIDQGDIDAALQIKKEIKNCWLNNEVNLWHESGDYLEALKIETAETQKLYDWIGLDIDIRREIFFGKVLLPTKEEYEKSKEKGFSKILFIPGQIDRVTLCQKTSLAFQRELNPDNSRMNGVCYFDGKSFNNYAPLMNTAEGKKPTCPQNLYAILMKEKFEGNEAYPELWKKTASEIDKAIKDLNIDMEKDNLSIDGLTLEQGIIFLARRYMEGARPLIKKHTEEVLQVDKWQTRTPQWKELAEFLSINHCLFLSKEKVIGEKEEPWLPKFLNIWWHSSEAMVDELSDISIRAEKGFWGGNDYNKFDRVQLAIYPEAVRNSVVDKGTK